MSIEIVYENENIIIGKEYKYVYNNYTYDEEGYEVWKYGCLKRDDNGNLLFINNNRYNKIENFKDGCAIVVRDNKYGIINSYGAEIVPTQYDWISIINDNLIRVAANSKNGVINYDNDVIIPIKFNNITMLKDGIIQTKCFEGINFFDNKGNKLFDCYFDNAKRLNNGMIKASINRSDSYIKDCFIINKDYKIIKHFTEGEEYEWCYK